MDPVYFDNSATTPIRPEVVEAMANVLKNEFGNPSSSHSYGRSSKSLVENSRKEIAAHFNAHPGEIIFTSGGTEADNLAMRSSVKDLGVRHIITSRIEHHAILHTADSLASEFDIKLSFVNLEDNGVIDLKNLEDLIQENEKTLVSLMHVNNEVGNLLDLKKAADICKKKNALFHSDCVQSVGHFHIDVQDIPIDFFAASAHKFHGPKGVGFSFIRKSSGLKPLIIGGEQERGLRAGTECVHNIVGLAESLKYAYENMDSDKAHIEGLKFHFIHRLKAEIPGVKFNGCSADRELGTYTLVNVCLPVPEDKAAMFLFQLDLKGIACSKGSACQSGSDKGSHVLAEILSDADLNKHSIRFSFGIFNTKKEVDYVVEILKELISVEA
ncbi:MAG: cysteine desulfurase [Flavobacteriaceae bacterium]|nr:cysteine desulfurase [Flavobacteriaceae bacterium]